MTSRVNNECPRDVADGHAIVHARYKRPFDIAVVFLAGVVLAPLWLIVCVAIAVAIRLEDRGRVFHVQTRLGRGGRHFEMYKFRTMVEEAEKSTGAVWAAENDWRITRVGTVLRPLHLDEIPQILNVLKGDMSLVGPRPERPEIARLLRQEQPEFYRRLRVRPGIAGLAQTRRSYYASARQKYRYDNLYIAKMNPLLDLKLLAASFLVSIGVRRLWPGHTRMSATECRERNWRPTSAVNPTDLPKSDQRPFGLAAGRGEGRP